MSLEIARRVHADAPQLLTTNIGATCHQFTVLLIDRLRELGLEAYHVCKSPGEGQYIPPGFAQRTVTGLDGRPYQCSGVSHDAIWCDGKIFDTIASANDGDEPSIENGRQVVGVPVWNAVPSQYWRNQNPPLKTGAPPQPPVATPYPGDAFFVEQLGNVLAADYAEAGQQLNAGSAVWLSRTIWRYVHEGMPIAQSTALSRKEWRAALGLPPPVR